MSSKLFGDEYVDFEIFVDTARFSITVLNGTIVDCYVNNERRNFEKKENKYVLFVNSSAGERIHNEFGPALILKDENDKLITKSYYFNGTFLREIRNDEEFKEWIRFKNFR